MQAFFDQYREKTNTCRAINGNINKQVWCFYMHNIASIVGMIQYLI